MTVRHNTRHFLIIGGGLAGSSLALRLSEAGQQVTLIDNAAPHAASRVAAGLYNVITGRFSAKTWMAESLLDAWKKLLETPAGSAARPFVHPAPIYRPFKEVEEYNKWLGRSGDAAWAGLVRLQEQPWRSDAVENPLGGLFVEGCGWAEVGAVTEAWLQALTPAPGFRRITADIPYSAISLNAKTLSCGGEQIPFDELVFCEGYRAAENPFFPGLPVIPNKGELLLIEAPELDLDAVLTGGGYLCPLGGGRYVAGSTYAKHFEHAEPTAGGRAHICNYLDGVLKLPYRVLEQRAGIRPTTPDRRPIAGTHPAYAFVHILTGFGTKGVLYAPYLSACMAASLLEAAPLPAALSLARF